jgi:SulP family sulfate permease
MKQMCCAMIGQTVINLEAGGHQRLAGIVEALAILAYIVFASFVIESIPIAALIGVMCVVCYHTFDWASLNFKGKPIENIVVMLTVTVTTFIFNLAFAVLLGILLTSVLYYWKHVKDSN